MKILHYSLGLPPVRRGGLVKYNIDLMLAQSAEKDNVVFLFYPSVSIFHKRHGIRNRGYYENIEVFSLNSSVFVPLLDGISNPEQIFRKDRSDAYKNFSAFLKTKQIEVLHLHTLMGLPLECLLAAKDAAVRIIYTTHDYFGICPKVNLINYKGELCADTSGQLCNCCNSNAISPRMQVLRDFELFHLIKPVMRHIKRILKVMQINQYENLVSGNYIQLRKYYETCFGLVDMFHFNSKISQAVFCENFRSIVGKVIPITHRDISDQRITRKPASEFIRFGFIGDTDLFKGFEMICKALNGIEKIGLSNWSLIVYSNNFRNPYASTRIINKGSYSYQNIKSVFDTIDLLIVPSIWKETFSFITLEAISYGLPVLVSENVGAKDIISQYNDEFIFAPDEQSLQNKLLNLIQDNTPILNFNETICTKPFDFDMSKHISTILRELYITSKI